MARRWTQCPTSASGSGSSYGDCRPRLIGRQVLPASRCGRRPRPRWRRRCARRCSDPGGWCAGTCRRRRAARDALGVAQSGELLPCLPAIGGLEECGVFHPGVDRVGIGQRRLEMPDPLELPGMLGAVVPLVGPRVAVICEFVADRFPGFAAIVGALDGLPEPAAGLRCIDPVRINGRALEMVNLPTREMRAADIPLVRLPSAVRMKAPLCVPTRTRTPLNRDSFRRVRTRYSAGCGALHTVVVRPYLKSTTQSRVNGLSASGLRPVTGRPGKKSSCHLAVSISFHASRLATKKLIADSR